MNLQLRSILAVSALLAMVTTPGLAQTKLRFQSAFPQSSLIFENGKYFTERVKAMTGGKLQIEIMPAGAMVAPFEALDAVHKGVVDGSHSAAGYWLGKHRAAGLFGPSPGGPFGMDFIDYMGWLQDGGGMALYRELYQKELKRNVVPIPMTATGHQVLGWFKTPIKNWDDLKGRKCRQTAFTAEVFGRAGMKPVNMPGGEIVPAGERGVIECAEFSGPAEDMKIGFQAVWKNFYMPSVHEPATVLEVLVNGDVWNKLPPEYREIILSAANEATLRAQTNVNRLNAEAISELQTKHGVSIQRTPPDILTNILKAWDEIAKEESGKSPFFKKVYDSQRAYAAKVVPARRAVQAPYAVGADHYWPEKK